MYSTYLMPTARLCWFCCLAWQSFGSSSKRDDVHGEPGSAVSRACRGKCVGPSPRGVHRLRVEDLDHNRKLDNKNRNVLPVFPRGLQMLHSAEERAFVSMFLCAHWFVSVAPCFFDSHPALSPFALRRRVIKLYWFYSISCHYQQQYDNWLYLAAGEQWRQ